MLTHFGSDWNGWQESTISTISLYMENYVFVWKLLVCCKLTFFPGFWQTENQQKYPQPPYNTAMLLLENAVREYVWWVCQCMCVEFSQLHVDWLRADSILILALNVFYTALLAFASAPPRHKAHFYCCWRANNNLALHIGSGY